MDKDTAIKRLIDVFILDGGEYAFAILKEQAAKDCAEAMTLLTGNEWIWFKSGNPDIEGFGIMPKAGHDDSLWPPKDRKQR